MTSAPNSLHLVAQPFQFGHKPFPLIALNLDASILDRASGPAALLELGGKFSQSGFVQRHIENSRHAFASPASRLPADLDGDRLSGWLLCCETIRDGSFVLFFNETATTENAGDE